MALKPNLGLINTIDEDEKLKSKEAAKKTTGAKTGAAAAAKAVKTSGAASGTKTDATKMTRAQKNAAMDSGTVVAMTKNGIITTDSSKDDAKSYISNVKAAQQQAAAKQASATAVSKSYRTAGEYRANAGRGIVNKPTGAATAAKDRASGKGIANTYSPKTVLAAQKEAPAYTPSLAQRARNGVGNSIAQAASPGTASPRTAPEYDVFLSPAQRARNAVGQDIANRYNEGEKWLTSDDGTDYLVKGFVNRLRSTGGKAVEDLAYFLTDSGKNSIANTYGPGDEITLENREAARLKAMQDNSGWLLQNAEKVLKDNTAGKIADNATEQMTKAQENADTWLGKQLVMATDSTATMLGYMLVPGGKAHLAAYMGAGGGLDEYRRLRESGASDVEAATRGITKGAISYLVESMGGIGAGVGQKIPGVGTISKKLDEFGTKNFFTSVLSNAMDEGGEELVEYTADYVANCLADMMFKGEVQTDFDISEMFQNALTGAIVGGGFGAVNASPEIASTARDIVEAVKNKKAAENTQAQTQLEGTSEGISDKAENNTAKAQTGQEAGFASPAEKTFEQRAEETRPLTQEEIQEIKKGARTITDADGNTYIDIQSDILANVSPKNWIAKVKNVIRSVFPKGFYINGEHIDVTGKSRGEFTNSTESKKLAFYEPDVYADKMRTSPYLDVISQNAQYQNEIPTHERADDIVNFERGEIDLKIGNNNYTTDVVIGVKKNGSKIFYDLSNIKKTEATPSEPEPNSRTSEQLGIASNNNVPQDIETVNSQNQVNYRNLQSISDKAANIPAKAQTGQEAGFASGTDTSYVNTNVEGKTPQQVKTLKDYIGAVNTKPKELAENYRSNKNAAFTREKFSDVNDRQINDIGNLTGIDVTGYKNGINKNGFNHIEKRHGINGEADQTMADTNDVARIPWVLENYDKAELVMDNGQQAYSSSSMDKNNRPAPLVRFSKAIDGTVYVVEAVPDSQQKTLWVETAYINKNGKPLVRATDAFAPSSTPEASHTAELSNNSIPDFDEKSNSQNQVDYRNLQSISDKAANIPAKAQTGQEAGFASVSPQEEAGLLDYKSSLAYTLNEKFRKGIEFSAEEKNAIKSIDNALAKVPKYKGVTKRELVFDTKEELLDFVNQHIAGDNIIYIAYTSTTKGEYPMEGRYKAHVTIDGVSGADISSLGDGTEQEVLYPRDILFDVISVSLNGNEATIYLKEVYDGRVGDGTQVRETETNDSVLFQMQTSEPGQTDVQSVSGGNTVGNNSREGEARTVYPGRQRNTVRAEITDEAGAESPGFSDGKNIDNYKNTVYAKSSRFATIAPYYDTNVTSENKAEVKNAVDNDFRTRAEDVAFALGIKIKNVYSNMGGFEFSEGEIAGKQVNEISYTFELENSTPEQAQLFASLMGENGYEQQEAVISKSYVDNVEDSNAREYDIRYNGLDAFAVADMLKRNGISDYTIDETTNTIQLLAFDESGKNELLSKIDNLVNEMGDSYYGTEYSPVQSDYLDAGRRAGIYQAWLDKGTQDGELRDSVAQSLQKVQGFIRKNAGTEITDEAGAEGPGFSNGKNIDNYKNTVYAKSSRFATIAPYYDTNVTAENKAEVKNAVDNDFRTRAEDVAFALGVKIKNVYSNMGGFEFSEGEIAGKQVNEISYTFELENSTPEQAQLFASLMGENGYEQQEAVISKSYVDNINDGNAYEYDVRYNGLDVFAVADMLKRNGISDYTIDETTNAIQILDFDTNVSAELKAKIKNLINEMGGNYYGTDFRPVQSTYLDARNREMVYRKWLDESGVHGSTSLRDSVAQSLQKVQGFIRKNAGAEITDEAGAESPGFSNGKNSADYRSLQNITNRLYGSNDDIYAPFYVQSSGGKTDIYEPFYQQAQKGPAAAKDAEKVSLGKQIEESTTYSQNIDNSESLKKGGYITVGRVLKGSALNKIGLADTNIYFDVSKINKSLDEHSDHITKEVLKQVPKILDSPIAVAEAGVDNTVNVFGEVYIGNSPLMVGLMVTKSRDGKSVINKVRTVHARRDAGNKITDDNILYLNPDKKRTLTWFQALGNVVPLGGTKFGFIRSIAQRIKKVNTTSGSDIKNEFARITTTNEEIESNMKNVARMDSVYDVDKSKLQKTGKRPSEIFADFFGKWGNRINSKKFGEISLGNSSVKSEVRHGITAEKIASIEAIPEVIEKGEVIFSEPKNERTSRIVVCAPIKIGETPYYMGVMLQRDAQNQRLYLHNVAIEKETTANSSTADLLTTGADDISERLFMTSILQKAINVKYAAKKENSANIVTADTAPDAAAATNSPSMETSAPARPAQNAGRVAGNADVSNNSIPDFDEKSNSQNQVDYRNLQNISDDHYNRPEGNTVGAKQSIEGTYANAQNKYDVFPEGEKAARAVDVPKKMNDETNVTRFARTEMEAAATPDSLIPIFENAVEQGDFSYNEVTDKSAVDRAAKRIEKDGYEKSIGGFISKVDEDKILNKNDLVLGEMLYAQAANAGDVKSAMELASALAREFTKAGQAVEAAKILKKLSPEGRLYNAQKTADKLFKDGVSKSEIKIDEELAQELLSAKTDAEIEAAEEKIKNNIAEQIEKTPGQKLADKWNAWRYLSMLGNPKTHIRNFLGNAAFYPVRKMKNAVKSVLEVTAKEKTATLKRPTREQRAFAKESYDRNAKMLMSGGSYRFESDIESREQIFKFKVLEAVRKANGNALEAEDAFFLKNAYIDSLSQYLRANDIDTANITPQQQAKAESYAQEEAWKATYRDASKVASALEKFSKTNKATKFAMDAFLPFRKTPINVLARGIEYSPVGLVKGIVDITARAKKVGASTAIDEIASGLTGTGITALGYWLASMGLLSGGDDDNDRIQNFEELQGKQNYALDIGKIADSIGLNIGDINYTIDWAAPTSLPLFVGVELYNALQTGEFDTKDAGRLFSATLDTISKTADPMIGLSMLQNLETVISGNYDGNAFSGLLGEAVIGYILQAFPTFGSQIAQTIDGTKRNAYFKDPNSRIPEEIQIPLNRIMQKIPGLSQMLPERVDEWGRTEKQSDNVAMRVFENFVSPGYIGRGNTTKVDKYLDQLYVKTGDNSILPSSMAKNFTVDKEKTNLSAKQYEKAQKVKGQTAYNLVDDVIENQNFKKLSAEEQAEVIADIYKYATAAAKNEVSSYQLTGWMAKASEAEKQGLSVDDYITLHKINSGLEKTSEKSVPEQFLDQLYVSSLSDKEKVAALEYVGGVNVDKYRAVTDDPKGILALYDITSFDDAKGGQTEKEADLEQIKKKFGTDIYGSREIYYKATDQWYDDYDEAIAGGKSRDKKAPVFQRFNFSEKEVTAGYNAVIGLNSAEDMKDALYQVFRDTKKATTFYNILKGKKGYK